MMNTVFFGAKGLTATSANFVANLAKEYVDRILTELGKDHYSCFA